MRRVRQRGPSTLVIGIVTLAVIAIATFFGFTKANPFADPYEIKVAFRNASDIKPKSPVRIAGVNIGKVKKVERGEGDSAATVTLEIDEKGLPIHRDAKIKIRPRIFLEGNYFVDVSPGSPSAPAIEKGETIPVNQTASPVGFGQLLETLQSDTREDLKTVLHEYGKGLKGGAEGYNRSIPYQKRAFRDSAIVNEATLGEQPARPVGLHRGRRRGRRGAGPQSGPAQVAHHRLRHDRGRLRRAGGQPLAGHQRAAAHRDHRPRGARGSQPRVPQPAPLRRRHATRRAQQRAGARRVAAAHHAAARPRLRAGAARTGRRPQADGAPSRGAQRRRRAAPAAAAAPVELPEHRRPAHRGVQGRGPGAPVQRSRLPGRHQVVSRDRRREPLLRRQRPVHPHAWRRARTTPTRPTTGASS